MKKLLLKALFAFLCILFTGSTIAQQKEPGLVQAADPNDNPGTISLGGTSSSCEIGQICASFTLPRSGTSTGSVDVSLSIYQNNTLVKTLTSGKQTELPFYCFRFDPATLGLNYALDGFDFSLTGNFTASNGFALAPITVGNPPGGQIPGVNNDYLFICPNTYFSKPTGDLHNVLSWGRNRDGSGTTPPDFTVGKNFQLANRGGSYIMTGDWTIGGVLNIPAAGLLFINGSTLSVADITGDGFLSGTRTSNVIVTTTGLTSGGMFINFDASGNNLNNLTILSTANTNVGRPLNIYGVLSSQAGTLFAGSIMTLKSTASGTASVAPVKGNIFGDLTVERYVPARRAWRIMSAPVITTQTINQAWQEGATTSSANSNPNPGYGTHITEGSAADGFDHNPLVAMKSVKKYVSATDTWNPLANTNATAVNGDAYMLFVRGDRAFALGENTVPATNTTLRAKGGLKVGDQTFPVSASGFTAIPNPYAAPINFATITKTNVQNNFYLWDPKMGGPDGVGAYVLLSFNGTSYDVIPAAVSPESQYIQSGQGFLVHSTGAAGSITIKESDKSGTPAADVFRVAADVPATGNPFDIKISSASTGLRVSLQTIGKDNKAAVLDEVFSAYGNQYSDKIDNMDADKMSNMEENLAILKEGHILMAERSAALDENDVIQLKIWNTSPGKAYQLEFNPVNLRGGVAAYLQDNYLKTSTRIELNKISQLVFQVNADAASASENRFSIAFTPAAAAAAGKTGITTYPNPLNGKTIQLLFNAQQKGTYKVQLLNSLGQVMHTTQINHAGGTAVQQLQLSKKPVAGIYSLNITNAGLKNSIKIVVR